MFSTKKEGIKDYNLLQINSYSKTIKLWFKIFTSFPLNFHCLPMNSMSLEPKKCHIKCVFDYLNVIVFV